MQWRREPEKYTQSGQKTTQKEKEEKKEKKRVKEPNYEEGRPQKWSWHRSYPVNKEDELFDKMTGQK